MEIKYFKPLNSMLPIECGICEELVKDREDGVLIQENVPGGKNRITHIKCLENELIKIENEDKINGEKKTGQD